MFCRKCGKEIADNSRFCPECGAEVKGFEGETVYEEVKVEQPRRNKCWDIFAKLGFGLGLAGLIACVIPYVCMVGVEVAAAGLVFSILGKKSFEFKGKSKAGIILSAIGLGVGFIMCIVTGVIMGLSGYNSGYYYY